MKKSYIYYFVSLFLGAAILVGGAFFYVSNYPGISLSLDASESYRVSLYGYGFTVLAFIAFLISLVVIIKITNKMSEKRKLINYSLIILSLLLVSYFGHQSAYHFSSAYQHYIMLGHETGAVKDDNSWPAK